MHKNELNKSCFAYNAVYSNRKYLAKRTIFDKILKDIAYEIVRNRNCDEY